MSGNIIYLFGIAPPLIICQIVRAVCTLYYCVHSR